MITFIIPYRKKENADKWEKRLLEKFPDSQVIAINGDAKNGGEKSFFSVWKKALPKVKGEYVCLTHDDTIFHHIPDLNEYFKDNVGLVGVAGAIDYNINDTWWFDRFRFLNHKLSGQIYHNAPDSKGLSFFGDYGGVRVLDGVCMVTKTEYFKKILPKIKVNVTWDWYDHVLSKAYRNEGYRLKTIPILITHMSAGGLKRDSFEKEKKEYMKWYDKTDNND